MAKIDKRMHEYRMSGARWMYDYIKEHGMEEAEKELKVRGAVFLPMEISVNYLQNSLDNAKADIIDKVMVLTASVLRDEFEFGKKRIERFMERFNEKTECYLDDLHTWNEQIEQLKEEIGIEFFIRENK